MGSEWTKRSEPSTKGADASRVRPVADTPRLQLKLRVGSVDDPLEREADRVAAEVLMRLADTATLPTAASQADGPAQVQRSATAQSLSRTPGHGREGGDADEDVARRVQRSAGGGRPMEHAVRDRMQKGFGADFAAVRVHADREADGLSRSLNARAFTTGSDIYFGAGQYRPETPSGQELLAHELTHTLQQGSERVQRSAVPASQVSDDRSGRVRRWDLKAGVDVSKATKISTIDSGKSVFMLKDASGDQMVIKAEDYPLGVAKLAALVHQSVHDVDIIDVHEVDAGQAVVLKQKIGDPTVTSDPSWAALGAGKFSKGGEPGDDAATRARKVHQANLGAEPLQAQAFAKGQDAKAAAKSTDSVTGLRAMLTSPKYMRQLGSASAADMLTGNTDRATALSAANLGNWVATADQRVQLIDNMDNQALDSFTSVDAIFGDTLVEWGKNPQSYYEGAIRQLLKGARLEGDTTIEAWADADGGFTRRWMVDDYAHGFEQTLARIVKLYAGSDKAKKQGRQAKADVKALGNNGQLDFWEVLKARARYMQNPSKGPALKKQVLGRQRTMDKKAAKKK